MSPKQSLLPSFQGVVIMPYVELLHSGSAKSSFAYFQNSEDNFFLSLQ